VSTRVSGPEDPRSDPVEPIVGRKGAVVVIGFDVEIAGVTLKILQARCLEVAFAKSPRPAMLPP
jgi:hypothetical protein